MAAAVIAQASTAGTQSSELTHTAGTPVTYVLKGEGRCRFLFKDSGAALIETAVVLDSDAVPPVKSCVVDCAGVYRWERVKGNCGVQSG
jgi:hypothetical protein